MYLYSYFSFKLEKTKHVIRHFLSFSPMCRAAKCTRGDDHEALTAVLLYAEIYLHFSS